MSKKKLVYIYWATKNSTKLVGPNNIVEIDEAKIDKKGDIIVVELSIKNGFSVGMNAIQDKYFLYLLQIAQKKLFFNLLKNEFYLG